MPAMYPFSMTNFSGATTAWTPVRGTVPTRRDGKSSEAIMGYYREETRSGG